MSAGDVDDPFSWQDAQLANPPKDYAGSGAPYQYVSTLLDVSMPIQYTGLFRSGSMQIPWQYVPGTDDLGAFINVSLDGGTHWVNTRVAPAGGGQTLTGTLYVNITGATLPMIQVTRGPSLAILAGVASMNFDGSATPSQKLISGTIGMTFGASGTATAIGVLSGTAGMVFGGAATWSSTNDIVGLGAITFGQAGTLTGTGALAGTAALTFGQSGNATAASNVSWSSTIVAGTSSSFPGQVGYFQGFFGSTTHLFDSNGASVQLLDTQAGNLVMQILDFGITQTYFTTLVVNGTNYSSASATFSYNSSSGVGKWTWGSVTAWTNGSTYICSYS